MNKLFIIKLSTVLNNFQTYGSGLAILYNKILVNKISKNGHREKQVTYA
jgi:hypothetical protein